MYDRFNCIDYFVCDGVYRRSLSEFAPISVYTDVTPDTRNSFFLSRCDTDTIASLHSDSNSDSKEDSEKNIADTPGNTPSSETPDTEIKEQTTEPGSESGLETSNSETVDSESETGTETETESGIELETEAVSGSDSEAGSETETSFETESESETFTDIPYGEVFSGSSSLPESSAEVVTFLQSIDSGIQTLNFCLSGLFFILLFHVLSTYIRRMFRRFFFDGKTQ